MACGRRRTARTEATIRRELASGEQILHLVRARVWAPSTNARSTIEAALVDNDNRAAFAGQVVEGSGLPLAPTREMVLALSDQNLFFCEKSGWLHHAHYLGKVPLSRISRLEGQRGDNRRQVVVLVALFLLIFIVIGGAEYLDGWVLLLLAILGMAVATFEGVHAEYSSNSILIAADGAPVRLTTPLREDPVAFATCFEASKRML